MDMVIRSYGSILQLFCSFLLFSSFLLFVRETAERKANEKDGVRKEKKERERDTLNVNINTDHIWKMQQSCVNESNRISLCVHVHPDIKLVHTRNEKLTKKQHVRVSNKW